MQALIIAPTREIAFQIHGVICSIGKHTELICHPFIGGLSISDDVLKTSDCQILVATPGRMQELIEREHVDFSALKIVVLDEADKLLDTSLRSQTM